MTDRVNVLTPAQRPLPSFPKVAGIALGVAVLACIPLSPTGPWWTAVPFGLATAVALLSAGSVGTWMEESFYAHFAESSWVTRTLVALGVPVGALGLSVPVSLLGVPFAALGDDGVLSAALLTGMVWLGLAGTGTLIVVLLDVTASRLLRGLRSRIVLTVIVLVGAVSALTVFVIAVGDRLARLVLEGGAQGRPWELALGDELVQARSNVLIGPEDARLLEVLLWCVAALLSLPMVLSACSKLADAIMEALNPLARGFAAVGAGDSSVRVEEAGSEDVVELGKGFNAMVGSLALARRMERAFAVYVSKPIFERVREQNGEAAIAATQKEATVFFANIRDFTAMSERLAPAEVLGLLNRYFERAVDVVDAYDGFLNKFIGDTMVVVFNGPIEQPDHAARAARCAIALQREVARMVARGELSEAGDFRIGIGIATGPVVAGNLGSTRRMEYTLIGDTVNLAARLTAKTPGGEIWANEASAVALPRELKVETLTPVVVKGKQKPVLPYRLWPAGVPSPETQSTAVDLPPLLRTGRNTMALATHKLTENGPELTRVGFGSWAVGGGGWSYGWGPQADLESIAAIRRAVSLGINWIDTAAIYGLGHAEEVVASALADLPQGDRPWVFTKCGLLGNHKRPFDEPVRDLRPKSIRRECEASLKRLRVATIDLYQIHWPASPSMPVEDAWGELARLSQEGKIRWLGVSNFEVDLLERCNKIRHVDSLQPPFSMIRRNAAKELIPWCAAHRTGVIVYSPMQAGLLTDRFRADRVAGMADDDWRKKSADFKPPRLSQNLALRDALKPIADRHQTTVAAVAVAWTLAFPGVTGAIVGGRTPAQVDGWAPAAALTLTDADLDEIAVAIDRTGAGVGPNRP